MLLVYIPAVKYLSFAAVTSFFFLTNTISSSLVSYSLCNPQSSEQCCFLIWYLRIHQSLSDSLRAFFPVSLSVTWLLSFALSAVVPKSPGFSSSCCAYFLVALFPLYPSGASSLLLFACPMEVRSKGLYGILKKKKILLVQRGGSGVLF